jgi:cellulose synthase/poly-beta-1,6-N-acetylglucosamine synthase-like glycosyltransferase
LGNGVAFIELPFRGGKVAAQNHAMMEIDTDIYVFSDAAIQMDNDCIKLVVQNFNDEKVGVVSCRDMVIGEKMRMDGEASYIRYDMMVRRFATKFGSLIGVTGGFYAVRRQIAKGGWNPAFPPDFYIALRCLKKGYRVIEDSRVKAYYRTAGRENEELVRKIRTLNRGMQALFSSNNIKLLNIFKYRMTALELLSHKVLRWTTPIFLICILITSLILSATSITWFMVLWSQVIFYLVGLAVYFYQGRFSELKTAKLIRYFMMANMAILIAWFEFLAGKKYVMWQPTKR